MRTTWGLSALAAAVAVAGLVSEVQATSVSSQCAAVTTCYEGGDTSNGCVIADGGCPVCVTFADDGCYVKVDGECPFGNDCTDEFSASSGSTSSTASSSASATSASKSTTGTGSSTSGTASASSTASNSTSGTSSSSTSGSGSSTTSTSDSSGSGSDLSVVFAIIGAAIGVIAVAVIFLTLVRRSRAAHDDDDDLADTPPAFTKNVAQAPASTTGTANYSSYGGSGRSTGLGSGEAKEIGMAGGYSSGGVSRASSGPGGTSSGVVNYYSQQPPQNSAAPSPRVAGRAIPSVPVGMAQSQSSVRSMAVPAPAPYAEMARPGQAPPTPVQHYPVTGGVAPSPVATKRESYEF